MVQEIGALLLFLILKANVLLSFDKQEEKVTVDGYINSIVVPDVDVDVGVEVTWLVGIGVDGVEDVARDCTDVI